MKQTLYGDVLFLVNFTMDFLTLFVTAQILHRRVSTKRLAAAAAVGALYGVAACFMKGIWLFRIAVHLAVSILMCRIAFQGRLLPCCALFYGTGCLLGGILTALFGLISNLAGGVPTFSSGGTVLPGRIPLGWMAVAAAGAGAAAVAFGRYERKRRTAVEVLLTVSVFPGQEGKSLRGLCDSGNLLSDPASGRPVVLVAKRALLPLLPEPLLPLFSGEDVTKMAELPGEYLRAVRLIPSESVGGRRLLPGLLPAKILVDGIERNAVIACAPSGTESFGGAEALVPALLCAGG